MQNEIVKRFVELAEALAPIATDRHKGSAWRAMLFHLGDIFPEDRAEILAFFDNFKASEQPKPEAGKFQGTITRGGAKAVKIVKKPCATCPDSTGATAVKTVKRKKKDNESSN